MTRFYKVYPITEIDNLDWNNFTQTPETCIKSLDGSQFIVQFINEPEGEYLTHNEAMAIKHSPEWKIIHPPDDESNDEYNEIDTDAN